MDYALGLTKVPLLVLLLASTVGMLPGTVLFVYIGSTARSFADLAGGVYDGGTAGAVLFAVGLAVTVGVVLAVGVVAKRELSRIQAEADAEVAGADAPVASA